MGDPRAHVHLDVDVDQMRADLTRARSAVHEIAAAAGITLIEDHPHEISWSLNGRGQLRGRLICSAGPMSRCHWAPDCGCEVLNGVDIDDQGPFHIAYEDPSEHGYDEDLGYEEVAVRHPMVFGEVCQVAEYVNADPQVLAENLAPDAGTVHAIGRTRVDLAWNGDYYEWKPVAS